MYGYMHPEYAQSLADFGTPRLLPRCGGWILERQIPGFLYCDAMGSYPMFCCQNWSQLQTDLENLRDRLVTLSLVTDPFGDYEPADLHRCFKDVVIPFKEHFLTDLHRPVNDIVCAHHRKYASKVLRNVHVEKCSEPTRFLDEWVALYDNLIDRHDIKNIKAFSRTAFARQLNVPGMAMFRAVHEGTAVGAAMLFEQGDVVYGHLLAVSERGYKLGAAYALYWSQIEYYSGKARWLDFGGVPGVTSESTDGLSWFKRGWSTDTRTAYFCGRIFDHKKYAEIVKVRGSSTADYFPPYRKGEFK